MLRSSIRLLLILAALILLIMSGGKTFCAASVTMTLAGGSLSASTVNQSLLTLNGDALRMNAGSLSRSETLSLSSGSLNTLSDSSYLLLNDGGSLNVGGATFTGNLGGSIIIIRPPPFNRPPTAKQAVKFLPYGPIETAAEFSVSVSELAFDTIGEFLRITAVQGPSTATISADGQMLQFTTAEPISFTATVADGLGLTCTATVQVLPAPIFRKTETRIVKGAEAGLTFEVPTLGYARSEVWVAFTKHAVTGSTHFTEDGGVVYAPMNGMINDDSFIFEVRRNNAVIAEVTVVIRNAIQRIFGNYLGLSLDQRWIIRITLELTGEYTASLRVGATTFRRRGNLNAPAEGSASESPALRLSIAGSTDYPELRAMLVTAAHGELTASLYREEELGALPVPRIHAQLNNSTSPPQIYYAGAGIVRQPSLPSTRLPASYMVLLRGSGPNAVYTGRSHDGQPWAGSCFVLADGGVMMSGEHIFGSLSVHRTGRLTGALYDSDLRKGMVKIAVGGSAFKQSAAGGNVFRGQLTPIQVRSPFPENVFVPGHLDRFGGLKTKSAKGVVYDLQIGSRDGIVSGTIRLPAINESRPVNGLFIPHRQSVVGFVGDSAPKPLTITRQ